MATWTTISNAAVAVGGIPSSTTVTALRDNPVAMAESASGSPVIFAGWHPVDKVTVGDGKTGLIYDAAINGTVPSVVSPDFEDGYEYRIVARDISHTNLGDARIWIDGFYETDAAYYLMGLSAAAGASTRFGCDVNFLMPRVPSFGHMLQYTTYESTTILQGTDIQTTAYQSPAQKILRARIRFSAGNIDAGKIWFFRRREYASLP